MPGGHLLSVERDAWLALFALGGLLEEETSLPGKKSRLALFLYRSLGEER